MDQNNLAVNRALTAAFIEDDPEDVTLIPSNRVKTATGSFKVEPGNPKPAQVFKLIYQGSRPDIPSETADGAVSKAEYVLVGMHDSDVELGDVFYDPVGSEQKWVVNSLQPFNGYEVKAGVVSYGKEAGHG